MSDPHETVVVGGGQAGLSVSHELTAAGVPHVVLERGLVGQTWRGRWDSFCLVTPNWSVQLPGHPYDGDDPDGFMPRDEIVGYLQRYATGFDAPVRDGVEVTALRPGRDGRLLLETSDGEIEARNVILSTGAYQRPNRPAGAASLPPDLFQIDVEAYRNPNELPAGAVLVVGSGQSGCQISEELHRAGRDVFLACGRAGWGRGYRADRPGDVRSARRDRRDARRGRKSPQWAAAARERPCRRRRAVIRHPWLGLAPAGVRPRRPVRSPDCRR